jgi:predicted DNA-binding ribbon-helix-helix protein
MKPVVYKRSVIIGGHKTSISLEEAFWREIRDIAAARGITVSALLREIDERRQTANLSSAIRVYVLEYVRAQADQARLPRAVGG